MMDSSLRQPYIAEIPELRKIWSAAFRSDDDELFFDSCFVPELSLAVICDSAVAAAGYLIPAGHLISGGLSFPCAMIYGVATHPEYRNRGFGESIVKGLIVLGNKAGYPEIVLCPTEDSLFGYYSARSCLRDWFYIWELAISSAPVNGSRNTLTQVTPDEYIRLREDLLSNVPHISFDLRTMMYQESLCRRYGGGFFRYHSPAGAACALIETQSESEIRIKELLAPDICDINDILPCFLAEITAEFPASRYIIRTPVCLNDNQSAISVKKGYVTQAGIKHSCEPPPVSIPRRFGMLAAPERHNTETKGFNYAPWYGIAFD